LRCSAKVLVCSGALARLKQEISQKAGNGTAAADLASRLAMAVLVHEHFHAAVAGGIDAQGRSAAAAESSDEWELGSALNESLAVWAELHFFRGDREMAEYVAAYFRSGDYPQWPYRGAELIECCYSSGGLPVVRTWIRRLRNDPANTQREFDKAMNAASGHVRTQ